MAKGRVARDPGDMAAKLDQQRGFLQRSAAIYDAGYWDEAARLALAIRVLVSPSGGTPILAALGVLDNMSFINTAVPERPIEVEDGTLHLGLIEAGGLQPSAARLVRLVDIAGIGSSWVPLLDDADHRDVHFDAWWTDEVITSSGGRAYSREYVVRTMANQDGGAHVAPALDAAYSELANDNLGVMLFDLPQGGGLPETITPSEMKVPAGNVAHATVRQIAHEMTLALDRQFPPEG